MKWDAKLYDSVKAPQVDAGMELIGMARVRKNDSILDIGCGTGKLTLELARLAHGGEVIGIDPSEEMIAHAWGKTAGTRNVTLLLASAESMGFTEMFDLAFSNSALQWVKEQQKALLLAHRALKPGGRIAFQLPAKDFCRGFLDGSAAAMADARFEGFFRDWESPWYFPSVGEYEGLLKAAGFRDIKVYCRGYTLTFPHIKEILDWWGSAGLRPFIEVLPENEREYFRQVFAKGFENARTADGYKFNFRRLFAFAEKT